MRNGPFSLRFADFFCLNRPLRARTLNHNNCAYIIPELKILGPLAVLPIIDLLQNDCSIVARGQRKQISCHSISLSDQGTNQNKRTRGQVPLFVLRTQKVNRYLLANCCFNKQTFIFKHKKCQIFRALGLFVRNY